MEERWADELEADDEEETGVSDELRGVMACADDELDDEAESASEDVDESTVCSCCWWGYMGRKEVADADESWCRVSCDGWCLAVWRL